MRYTCFNNESEPVFVEIINMDLNIQVNLDPVLAGVVLGKGENDVVTMKWDELNQRVNNK